jgi:hypothetical protein
MQERVVNPSRHIFLSIWLWLIIIANAFVAAAYFSGASVLSAKMPTIPMWFFVLIGVLAVVNIISAIALLKWRKWGFWALVATAIISCLLNVVIGSQAVVSALISSFLGVAILYWALNMGDPEKKAWPRLR